MKELLVLNKNVGETPLECINRFRAGHSEYADIKMTYAGRLDPIASGVLLVLAGEKVHEKEKFLGLPKTYQCTAILGVATDTYDILGMLELAGSESTVIFQVVKNKEQQKGDASQLIKNKKHTNQEGLDGGTGDVAGANDEVLIFNQLKTVPPQLNDHAQRIEDALMSFLGSWKQPYPPYSSKTINGKQLHTIAREMLERGDGGNVADMVTPKKQVTVSDIFDVSLTELPISEVVADVISVVQKVHGDFRQEEIIASWKDFKKKAEKTSDEKNSKLAILQFSITVSGGTYIRGIVHELGKKLGCGACIWKLSRVKVGEYGSMDA